MAGKIKRFTSMVKESGHLATTCLPLAIIIGWKAHSLPLAVAFFGLSTLEQRYHGSVKHPERSLSVFLSRASSYYPILIITILSFVLVDTNQAVLLVLGTVLFNWGFHGWVHSITGGKKVAYILPILLGFALILASALVTVGQAV